MSWNPKDAWVWSEKIVNPPIIDEQTFTDVQQMLVGRGRGPTSRAPYRKRHTYVLRGALFCGICRRWMQSHWINNAAYYRCRFPEEYALANKVKHPRNVYVREDAVLPALDRWLCRYFAPHRRAETINAMLAAHTQAPADDAASLHAQQTVEDCEARLARYRATLDALDQDSDPSVVAGWIAEAQAQRTAALAQLRQAPNKTQITREEIAALIDDLGDHAQTLKRADRGDKASVYQHLGLRLTYHPTKQTVRAEVRLDSHRIGRRSVSEAGLEPPWKRVLRRLGLDRRTRSSRWSFVCVGSPTGRGAWHERL